MLAQKEQSNDALAQTMGNIAQNADAYKDQVQARYDDKANALTQAQLGQSQMSEQGYSNMAAGGINMMWILLPRFRLISVLSLNMLTIHPILLVVLLL